MYRDYNYTVQNSFGHQCPQAYQCCPQKPQCCPKGLESFGTIWRPYDEKGFQLLNPGERVVFTKEEIIGNSVTHAANSEDIGLEAGGSYLIQYTTTVTDEASKNIIFSLVFADGTIVPGTTQATTVSPNAEMNIVSSSTIINTTADTIIRLVAQVPPPPAIADPVKLLSATITVVKIR